MYFTGIGLQPLQPREPFHPPSSNIKLFQSCKSYLTFQKRQLVTFKKCLCAEKKINLLLGLKKFIKHCIFVK